MERNRYVEGLRQELRGGIHFEILLWKQHPQEEDWGFLLIDAQNAFNEDNWNSVLWAVQYECPSGIQSTFNFYRYWAMLVIQGSGGTVNSLHSKEGVTQDDMLEIIVYGIRVPP